MAKADRRIDPQALKTADIDRSGRGALCGLKFQPVRGTLLGTRQPGSEANIRFACTRSSQGGPYTRISHTSELQNYVN